MKIWNLENGGGMIMTTMGCLNNMSLVTVLLYSPTAPHTQSRRLICGELSRLIRAASRKISTKSKQEGLVFSDLRLARPKLWRLINNFSTSDDKRDACQYWHDVELSICIQLLDGFKFGTQGFIDVLLSTGMLFEIAADVSKAGQHRLKVSVLLNLSMLDVLRSQVTKKCLSKTILRHTHTDTHLGIFSWPRLGITKNHRVPPGLRWIGWSAFCSGHPQTGHWTARCCQLNQEIARRWPRDLTHSQSVGSCQSGPWTANWLEICPFLHTSTSQKNRSSTAKDRIPSKPLAQIAALVEHDFQEACWRSWYWRSQTWPRMVSFQTAVGKDFKTNDSGSVTPNLHPRNHDEGFLTFFRTKLCPEPPAHVVISTDLAKNRKFNCGSARPMKFDHGILWNSIMVYHAIWLWVCGNHQNAPYAAMLWAQPLPFLRSASQKWSRTWILLEQIDLPQLLGQWMWPWWGGPPLKF